MADYYTVFSVTIPYSTLEQGEWLMRKIEEWDQDSDNGDEEERPPYCDEYERLTDVVWVASWEGGDVDALAVLVAQFQLRFGIEEPWVVTWASTCSELRVDSFGGGVHIVYRGNISGATTWEIARQSLAEADHRDEAILVRLHQIADETVGIEI